MAKRNPTRTLAERAEKKMDLNEEQIQHLLDNGVITKTATGYESDYMSQREVGIRLGRSNSTINLAISSKKVKKYVYFDVEYVKYTECLDKIGKGKDAPDENDETDTDTPTVKVGIDLSLLAKADKEKKRVHDLSVNTRLVKPDGQPIVTPKGFYVDSAVWESLHFAIANGENVLITGPTGCGKSELVYELADSIGRELSAFNCGATQDVRSAWIGNVHIQDGKDVFVKSRFIKASCEKGHLVLFDEINRINYDSTNILFSILDRQGYIPIDEDETKAMKHEDTRFFATANLGSQYTGTEEIDAALLNRFSTVIEIGFPPVDVESKIIENRAPYCNRKDIEDLLAVAHSQREQVGPEGMSTPLSTRTLIDCARRKMCGFDWQDVLINNVLGHFDKGDNDQYSEQAQVVQIFQSQGLIS